MRVGISIGTAFSTDGPGGHRQGPATVLDQVRAADRAGLDTLTLGDHHATGPAGYVQNVPMLGRILAEWTTRPVGCLFLVPLWHPVLMAEQIGTLAAISEGPFIVQTGLGGGADQFRAMGADLGQRAARLEEGIRVVQDLLHGETVESGLFGIAGARIAPLPPEGTEWWIGGGVEKAIDRAARLGDCWYGNADLTPETAARDITIYQEACARHDRRPVRIPIRKDVLIAESRAEAERAGDALVAGGYRGFDRAAVAYGDPAGVAEQLSVFGDLGFTDVIIRTMGPLPAELGPDGAARSVELAGEVRALLSASAADPGAGPAPKRP
jgi:alkanesulfonate monooxygenase SsuD/methylene tetrahydromethanopterin reductase-like flavin-dependent oxidoreductase (luciferase family)